ncbi:efflux RND transporter periplasmic adaptor subunit [Paenibacillus arenilitoris]|uniref:Efflux RND transporter periplasmic adaptor subunit n=1 Tax=Paenibacillus arenilitoris TaxID=2772299 RepID=A0A927CIZ1_9BACL|nr:efflux RND transporter periplasmic adaptor subunit [Paenibacillus arenilitoris]MBD2868374.1 efflux RND transporter periplasmic adaptor subunit [Paenibacillus arenilitoris]
MKRWAIGVGAVLILAAAGAGAYYYYFAKDAEATSEGAAALTAAATRGSIVKQISGTGAVAANTRETVTAGKSGTIAAVNVKVGDQVKAGQILVTFEAADDYDDQIESIEDNIDRLKEEIEGYQQSYKEATGTENEEAAKQDLQKKMEDAESDIADYEEDLQDIYEKQSEEEKAVTATIDGEVTEMDIEPGDEVQANTTIASIVDYTRLEFVTSVDELDIPSVKVGQAVDITLGAITDRTIGAAVSEIAREGSASNGSSSFEVSILLKDIEGVKAGMSGEAAITIESKEDIVLVPVNAVVAIGNRSFVRVPSAEGGTTGAAAGSGAPPGGRRGGAGGTAPDGGGFPGGEAPSGEAPAGGAQGGGTAPVMGGAAPAGDASTGTGRQAAAEGTAPEGASAAGGDGAQADGTGGEAPAGEGAAAAGGEAGAAAGGRGNMADRLASRIDTLGGELVEVTTGLSDENFVEIVSGLSEGDSVLVPIAQGTPGMGSGTEEQQTQIRGTFPGGGAIGVFPSGGGGGGMGGGNFQRSGGMP